MSIAAFCACSPKPTEYDNKQVAKIETYISFGEVMIYYRPIRTFDFETGTITDIATMSEEEIEHQIALYIYDPERFEYESADAYETYLRSYYNTSEQVATFTQETGTKFLKTVVSKGIYNWNETYDNHSYTCGSWRIVTFYFTDGTTKRTAFYDVRPKNYTDIDNAFQDYFGVGIYC